MNIKIETILKVFNLFIENKALLNTDYQCQK